MQGLVSQAVCVRCLNYKHVELLVNLLLVDLMEDILENIQHLHQKQIQLVLDDDKDAKRTFLIILLNIWKTVIEISRIVLKISTRFSS